MPANATAVTIASDGTVTATTPNAKSPTTVGTVQITTFPNPNGLNSDGHNLFSATSASGEPMTGQAGADGRGSIMQGALEGSNVDVVSEMVAMISAQRAYEMSSKVVSAADDMLRNATQVQ